MHLFSKPHFSRAESAARKEMATFLQQCLGKSLAADLTIAYPPDAKLGDFTVACFALAKKLGKSPAEIAREIAVQPLARSTFGLLSAVSAAGPYVNFSVNPAAYHALALRQIAKEGPKFGAAALGKNKTVLVEYFSPNTNKPLTIGHLRNVFLGWSLSQLLQTLGFKVVDHAIYNDRGIALCKSIVAYRKWGDNAPPESSHKKPDQFAGEFYVRFGRELSHHPELEAEARECLQQWEAGDEKIRAVWRKLVAWVMEGFTLTLQRVGLDHPKVKYFESDIYQHGRTVVQEGLQKGIFKRHADGYVYAPLKSYGMPDKILLRSDGTTLYITQDMYLAQLKAKRKPALSLYVVASEQDLAFQQLFKILELLGQKYQMHHVSYGMIRLPEGKIKSREGLAAGTGADELIAELDSLAQAEVKQRHADLPASELSERAHAVALAALKYYILNVNAATTMVFDPKQSLAFTGKTGPYLQYVHARCAGILEKAGAENSPQKPGAAVAVEPLEHALVVMLSRFPHVLQTAAEALDPSLVAHYLYDLAQVFSQFYEKLPVISSAPAVRSQRLQVVSAVKTVMARGLKLLGIPPLEKM